MNLQLAILSLRAALDELDEFPGGLDYEAAPDDAPIDAATHRASLAWRYCNDALDALEGRK